MTNLNYIKDALILDPDNQPSEKNKLVVTNDFDEIRTWSDKVYMPYKIGQSGKFTKPHSSLHAIKVGCMTISRFTYGIPVHLYNFSMDKGVGMLLTTLEGNTKHWVTNKTYETTSTGDSFIVDNSEVDYSADFDKNHLQINTTFPHDYLAKLHIKLFGCPAPAQLWKSKLKLADTNFSWIALLEYVIKCATLNPNEAAYGVLGKHLEEMIGTHILITWTQQTGLFISHENSEIAPNIVIKAEEYIRHHAIDTPTLTDIATQVGVSARSLSSTFKKFRDTTPSIYLRNYRLDRVREDLLNAPPCFSVCEIAYSWGYINLGRFAALYRKRFGELPSETIKK